MNEWQPTKSSDKPVLQKESSDDIWDDRLLIKAYELAVQLQSSDIAKSIAVGTNKHSTAKQLPPSNMSVEDGGSEDSSFKVGDYVRATYDVDNIDYEAQIIGIDEMSGVCVVKFIGYNNEQSVNINDLVDSWGEDEQKKQSAAAAEEVEEEDEDNESNDGIDNDFQYPKEIYRSQTLPNTSMPMPPIPPMPPMLRDSLGEESEHFSAMLMSWYMSGYYTGLYQGNKIAKQNQKHNSSKRNAKRK